MILLDENIGEEQCRVLRSWRIRFKQIGQSVGRQGMKDKEHILPLLHRLKCPTFVTRDLGFFDRELCHPSYCIICLAVPRRDAAAFARATVRHPFTNTKAKRMGTVMRASPAGLLIWRLKANHAERMSWQ